MSMTLFRFIKKNNKKYFNIIIIFYAFTSKELSQVGQIVDVLNQVIKVNV